jgi:hypothetical protein
LATAVLIPQRAIIGFRLAQTAPSLKAIFAAGISDIGVKRDP